MRPAILLVDDEPVVLEMLGELFSERGFTVEMARSAKAAIERLRSAPFDVVLTDVRMEHASAGADVVGVAKSLKPPPLAYVLSAFPLRRLDWRAYGADGMFMKAKGVDTMLTTIAQKVEQRRARGAAAGAPGRRAA